MNLLEEALPHKISYIDGFKLVRTCWGCPEQYDVFLDDVQVGYLRLRHGFFRAEHRDNVVYSSETKGDGMFDDDEREHHLNMAIYAIKHAMKGDHNEQIMSS